MELWISSPQGFIVSALFFQLMSVTSGMVWNIPLMGNFAVASALKIALGIALVFGLVLLFLLYFIPLSPVALCLTLLNGILSFVLARVGGWLAQRFLGQGREATVSTRHPNKNEPITITENRVYSKGVHILEGISGHGNLVAEGMGRSLLKNQKN